MNAKLDEFFWEWHGTQLASRVRRPRLMQPESVQLIRQIIHNAEDPTAEAVSRNLLRFR